MRRLFLWKTKKGITIINALQKFLDESGLKLSKIWVDTGSKLYNKSMKSWLQDNDIKMHSTNNAGKSVVAGNVYIDRLDDILSKYKHILQHSQNEACWCKVLHIYWP